VSEEVRLVSDRVMAAWENLDSELLKRGEELIVAGFSAARWSGREDWRQMTTPVLKNRILSVTNRAFSERDWRTSSFRDFLALYPGLVRVDTTTRPPTAHLMRDPTDDTPELTTQTPAHAGGRMTPDQRVRPDLWRSALDYSSGNKYVWTGEAAVSVNADEPVTEGELVLPTIDRGDSDNWREEFLQQQAKRVSPADVEAIERWRTEGLGTRSLPPALQGLWNAELKRHVVELLETWFAEHDLEAPGDLLGRPEAPRTSRADTEELRSFIQDCVAAMTRGELESLSLPSSASLRVVRRARGE